MNCNGTKWQSNALGLNFGHRRISGSFASKESFLNNFNFFDVLKAPYHHICCGFPKMRHETKLTSSYLHILYLQLSIRLIFPPIYVLFHLNEAYGQPLICVQYHLFYQPVKAHYFVFTSMK